MLYSHGVASIIVFRSKAPTLLKLVPYDENSELDISIDKVGKQIVREVNDINPDKEYYNIRNDKDRAANYVSDTVLALLAKISPKLDKHSLLYTLEIL